MEFILLLILLLLGFFFGRMAEQSHYKSIRLRESLHRNVLIIPQRFPPEQSPPPRTQLVSGSIVISVDFFKQFVAGLRLLVGGRLASYESLLDRARREAILRMKEDAKRKGANMIFNVKLETAAISQGAQGNIGSVEVYAYGTALIPADKPEKISGSLAAMAAG